MSRFCLFCLPPKFSLPTIHLDRLGPSDDDDNDVQIKPHLLFIGEPALLFFAVFVCLFLFVCLFFCLFSWESQLDLRSSLDCQEGNLLGLDFGKLLGLTSSLLLIFFSSRKSFFFVITRRVYVGPATLGL